jgi:hypothetical protein
MNRVVPGMNSFINAVNGQRRLCEIAMMPPAPEMSRDQERCG